MKVQHCAATDVLTRDGETAVLLDRKVVRLSELSATIWSLTQDWVEVGTLAQALESAFGTPQGQSSLDATKDAVADLVHHGVLRQSG